ncbi:hypothetical protein ACGFIW_05045 [Micromonospora sp. NPDC048935]
MRTIGTTPPTDLAHLGAGWPAPALTRRRHVDLMRMCGAACRGTTH